MLKKNPNNWDAWLNYSIYNFSIGNIDEGFACIKKALKIHRERAGHYFEGKEIMENIKSQLLTQ